MESGKIVCDSCNKEIDAKKLKFKEAQTKIDDREVTIVYYKCPKCGETYVISMLDYWGKKLQNKYLKAVEAYRKLYGKGIDPIKLKQKLNTIKVLKEEALAYQKTILEKYGNLIPEEILK